MKNKYLRKIRRNKKGKSDVYDVLVAFDVTCPARAHAIKKLLCSGIRGKGDVLQDLTECKKAVERAIELARPIYPQSYLDLVERVRAIDPDAAEYMLTVKKLLDHFNGSLSRAFRWEDTPQKYYYWDCIDERLSND